MEIVQVKRENPGVVWYKFYRSKDATMPVTRYVVHHPDYEITELDFISDYFCETEDERDLLKECILVAEVIQSRYEAKDYSYRVYHSKMNTLASFAEHHFKSAVNLYSLIK